MSSQPNGKSIPLAELLYNTTFHASAKTTPFQIVFGIAPPSLRSYGHRKLANNSVEQLLMERELVVNALKENLVIAQNRKKKEVDLHKRVGI